jgi:plastocyanin
MKKTLLKLKLITGVLLFTSMPAGFAATNTVTFGSFFFNPSTVNIQAGDTVVWTASSPGTHTVRAGWGQDARTYSTRRAVIPTSALFSGMHPVA